MAFDMFDGVTPEQRKEMDSWLVKAASSNRNEASVYRDLVAKALELPLRPGILSGDIFEDVFEVIQMKRGMEPKWPLHFLAPGSEKEFVSYCCTKHGSIPQRRVEGDFLQLSYYDIAGAIDCITDYLEDARWDVMSALGENLRSQFTKKINDDRAHVLMAAAVDRNIVVYDADAGSGQFTKRLVSLMKTVMRRNGGGNSSSTNRFKLTDLYTSPEAQEDMRNWGIDIADELTRREIYVAGDGTLNRVFNVNLHDIDELGESQEYQIYYANSLNGTLPSGDVEVVIGADLSRRRGAIMPVVRELSIKEDLTLARENLTGWYGRMSLGMAIGDGRQFILGSL